MRAIQAYIEQLFANEDETLLHARSQLKNIGVPPAVGKLLALLVKISHSKQILEIGTHAGISATYMARALPPGGHLTTLEIDPNHATIARQTLRGLPVTLLEGDAHALLPTLTGPFDLIFLDADKLGYPAYLEPLLALSHPGTLLLSDNLIRKGKVLDPKDSHMEALATYNQLIASHPRLDSLILSTLVGYTGGHLDGLGLSLVK